MGKSNRSLAAIAALSVGLGSAAAPLAALAATPNGTIDTDLTQGLRLAPATQDLVVVPSTDNVLQVAGTTYMGLAGAGVALHLTPGETPADGDPTTKEAWLQKDGVDFLPLELPLDGSELPILIVDNGKYTVVSDLGTTDLGKFELSTEKPGVIWVQSKGALGTLTNGKVSVKAAAVIGGVRYANAFSYTSIITSSGGTCSTQVDNIVTFDFSGCPQGSTNYLVTITGKDILGNILEPTSFAYQFDNTAPTLVSATNDGTLLGANTTSDGPLTFNVEAADSGAGVALVELLRDGAPVDSFTGPTGSLIATQTGLYTLRITDNLPVDGGVANSVTVPLQNVVIGSGDTSIQVLSNGAPLEDKWYRDPANLSAVGNPVSSSTYEAFLNGVSAGSGLDNGVSLDSSGLVQGGNNIQIMKWVSPNTQSSKKEVFKYDSVKPVLTGVTLEGEYGAPAFETLFSGNLALRYTKSDAHSGVKEVRLLKDGVVVETDSAATLNGSLSIDSSGLYSVEVEDAAGNITTATLTELAGVPSQFVKDSQSLDITSSISGTPVNVAGVDWYATEPTVSYTVTGNYLQSFKAGVFGTEVLDETSVGTYTVDLSTHSNLKSNNQYVLNAAAKTWSARQAAHTQIVNVDTVFPELGTASLTGANKQDNGKTYLNSPITLKITATDSVSGVKSVSLLKGGVPVDTKTTATSEFVINSSGMYTLSVTDNVGNVTTKSLDELFSISGEVIFDFDAPGITASIPAGTAVDNKTWYAKAPVLSLGVTDPNLKSFSLSVNGVQVKSGTSNEDFTYDLGSSTPDENGALVSTVVSEDFSGNVSEWTSTVYVDSTAPVVTNFTFTQPGFQEGKSLNGGDEYGYFFDGATRVVVDVVESGPSSGLSTVTYTLLNSETGKSESGDLVVTGGQVSIDIPNGFKGYVSAKATDRVGNSGGSNKPSGIVSEDQNWHVNNADLKIELPSTKSKDANGLPLYTDGITATVSARESKSGIRSITWGIGDNEMGTSTVDKDGVFSNTFTAQVTDKNLVTAAGAGIQLGDNLNGQTFWVETKDRAGHTSRAQTAFSIDKDAPKLVMSYNETRPSGQYNQTRTASISVEERNFNPELVTLTGATGTLGSWTQSAGVWRNTMTFAADGDYQWSIGVKDLAGNVGNTISSEEFTIDKAVPAVTVTFDNNKAANGNFYKDSRTATVTVNEHNFESSLVSFRGTGTLSAFSGTGDIKTATVTFPTDGEYDFTVTAADKSGNQGNTVSEGSFIIDKTIPTVEITGVEAGVSYHKGVTFNVKTGDLHIDAANTTATLIGRSNESIELTKEVNAESISFALPELPKESRYDDFYTLAVVVKDKAGNEVLQNVGYSVNRFGSTYTFVQEDYLGKYLNKVGDVEINETSVDQLDTPQSDVKVYRDGVAVASTGLWTVLEKTAGAPKWDYTYTLASDLFKEDGKYTVEVYSRTLIDASENSSISQTYDFVVDTKKPTVLVSGVEDNGTYKDVSRKVAVEVRDQFGLDSVKVLVNGTEQTISDGSTSGVYEFELQEGVNQTIEVLAVDKAGNESSESLGGVTVSSNWLSYLWNTSKGKAVVIGAALIPLLLLALAGWRMVVSTRRSRERSRLQTEGITSSVRESGTFSSQGSGSGTPTE